jgi:hypothetical protein
MLLLLFASRRARALTAADAVAVFRVRVEKRVLRLPAENRVLVVPAEDRVYRA